MCRNQFSCIVWLALSFSVASPADLSRPPAQGDTASVLSGLTLASFVGSNQDSIQAVATDSNGNIFVSGTTYSSAFPVRGGVQSVFGDARILRTTDLGVTWTKLGLPPSDVTVVVADPATSQVLFAGGSNSIYKSNDAGQTWRVVYSFPVGYSATFSLTVRPDGADHQWKEDPPGPLRSSNLAHPGD